LAEIPGYALPFRLAAHSLHGGSIEMTSWVRAVLVASALASTLAGCGVKGGLEAPQAQAENTAEAQSGQGKSEGAAPKPHKGFVLDGLLR
jgi:predicted small lipoprotein YifL